MNDKFTSTLSIEERVQISSGIDADFTIIKLVQHRPLMELAELEIGKFLSRYGARTLSLEFRYVFVVVDSRCNDDCKSKDGLNYNNICTSREAMQIRIDRLNRLIAGGRKSKCLCEWA